jgi:N-methylhydantoinase B
MNELGPVDLELFNNRLAAISEEMGVVLGKAGYSPNIKERRDFSCAVFDADGRMVTHAAHIPVHLGSTPLSVRAAIDTVEMEPGDIVILNDPYAGGTHLPDVTLVAPVHLPGIDRPYAYVADRAHHADIGGGSPGSMSLATEIYQEGLRLPPVHLVRGGNPVRETQELFLANTRVREERLGDLDAQIAALRAGNVRIRELAERFGPDRLAVAMRELQAYSERLVRAFLRSVPKGNWSAGDTLDGDGAGSGPLALRVSVSRKGSRLEIDFEGSSEQAPGPINANLAVTTSAVFYVIAALAGRDVPPNSGMLEPVRIRAPHGSIVNCRFPAAVAGGNVETSQRIVDTLLRALAPALPDRIPAASCGSMTNVSLGGYDKLRERHFSYYETVGGGAGAGPNGKGADAVQTHMTNTLNTPVEVLEAYYPMRVVHYRVRRGSGGKGESRGGDGIDREIEMTSPAEVSLLAERRETAPWGLGGAAPGRTGQDSVVVQGRRRSIAAKSRIRLGVGDRLRVRTPGGGGWSRS